MRSRACCVALLILSGVRTAVADPPILVHEYGDLSRLAVEGNETFTGDQIRCALEQNLEMVALTRPHSSFAQLTKVAARLIRDGYLKAGFADAIVDVVYDDKRDVVVASIQEGPRYRCGAIEVAGVDDDLGEIIRQRLTHPFLLPDDLVEGVQDEWTGEFTSGFNQKGEAVEQAPARWVADKPANFHPTARAADEKRVTQTLWEAGRYGAEVAVSLQTADNGSATMHVDVKNAGTPVVITEIVVDGAQKNSTEDVLSFLELQAPLDYTAELQRKLTARLWDCGRFRWFELNLENADDPGDEPAPPSRLRIELKEFSGAPLLTEELDEVDQVLCRAAHWLTTQGGRTSDLVVRLHLDCDRGLEQMQCAVGANGGAVANTSFRLHEDLPPVNWTLGAEKGRLVATSEQTGRAYRCDFTGSLRPSMRVAGDRDVGAAGQQVSMKLGMEVKSDSDDRVRLQFVASPMAMLYLAHRYDPECTLSDGVLTIRSEYVEARFDAETGRWIHFTASLDESEDCEISFEEHGFEETSAHIRDVQEKDVVGSLSTFIAGELGALVQQPEYRADSLITLAAFSSSLSDRLEHRPETEAQPTALHERFRIPLRSDDTLYLPPGVIQTALNLNSLLYPYGSTFRTFGQELVLGYGTHDRNASDVVEQLMNSKTAGPLFYWYAAEVLRLLNRRNSLWVAHKGLTRLDRERFVEDCRQLLTREGVFHEIAAECLSTLRDMDDQQLDALLALVAEPERRAAMIGNLRKDAATDDDVLLSLLGELWDAKLQDLVRERLETLSGGPEIRNANRRSVPDPTIHATALVP